LKIDRSGLNTRTMITSPFVGFLLYWHSCAQDVVDVSMNVFVCVTIHNNFLIHIHNVMDNIHMLNSFHTML
jgi:hypothetical protein